LHNFDWDVERSTAKTSQGIVWATGRLNECWNCVMHNLVWLLTVGIVQSTILARKVYLPRDRFSQFLGPSSHYPPKMHKTILEAGAGWKCTNLERKVVMKLAHKKIEKRDKHLRIQPLRGGNLLYIT